MKGTVYKCTFPNGKVYIGKSIHASQRMREHLNKSIGPSNPGFYEAYKTFGEPKYEILFEKDFSNILDRDDTLCKYETYYIAYYKATDPQYGYNVRNVSSFSAGVKREIEEKIEEITEELLEYRLKEYNVIKRKLWKTKEKLTQDELFFIKEKYRDYNIFQSCIDNFDFNDYNKNSDSDLEFLLDDALPFIKCIIETDTKIEACEYVRTNADELFKGKRGKSILKINELGEIVKVYYSMNDICEDLKIKRPDNIRNVINGKQKTAYGYRWMYKNEYEKMKNQNSKELNLFEL